MKDQRPFPALRIVPAVFRFKSWKMVMRWDTPLLSIASVNSIPDRIPSLSKNSTAVMIGAGNYIQGLRAC
jgi:hypothetical protein